MKISKVISVRPDHIANGKRGNGECCPIALAVKDEFPKSTVYVDAESIKVDGMVFPHGFDAKIDLYDYTGCMLPFSFAIYSPNLAVVTL